MAHKHNRRRVRPRSHHNRIHDLDSSSDTTLLFDSHSLSGLSTPTASGSTKKISQSIMLSSNNNVTAKHWRNRYVAWQKRDNIQRREAASFEAKQLQIFGGEPGDDVGLCYKMLEVFERMDWINY